MMSVREANVLALMSAAGVAPDEAGSKLDTRVHINCRGGLSERRLGQYLTSLLERTVIVVREGSAEVHVAIGGLISDVGSQHKLVVHVGPGAVEARESAWAGSIADASGEAPDLLLRIAACYLAGLVISRCVGGVRFDCVPIPFGISAHQLGLDPAAVRQPVLFDGDVLIGAGGVGARKLRMEWERNRIV